MSHAHGQVLKDGKEVAYFEYNGTCDVAVSRLWDSPDEVNRHWRSGEPYNRCQCGRPPAEVILHTNYGGGFRWAAKVCLECRVIVEGQEPTDFDFDREIL